MTLAVVLGGLVVVDGSDEEKLNLYSAIAGGLVVAVAVTFWEGRRRREAEGQAAQTEARRLEAQDESRRAMKRILTTFAGAELSNIATGLQLKGVDGDGNTVELFQDINEALAAFEKPKLVQMMVVELVEKGKQAQPGDQLTINAWDSVDRFYKRIAQQFDHMLSYFVQTEDERAVESFLELWKLQRSHMIQAHYLWKPKHKAGWLQNLVEEGAPKAAYLQTVSKVLHEYEELLKAIDEIPSGIPSRRRRY